MSNRHETGGDAGHDDRREWNRETAWLEAFGVKPPARENEASAPLIDDQAEKEILAFLRGESSPEGARRIIDLALRFRSWSRRLSELSFDVPPIVPKDPSKPARPDEASEPPGHTGTAP
jgi:hypothetical protein